MLFGSPTFRRFLRYAKPYRRLVVASITCGVLKFSMALLLPIALGLVTDYVILADVSDAEKLRRLAWLAGILITGYIIRIPITFYRSWFAELAGNRTIFDIRQDIYAHVQRLSLGFHSKHRSGSTASRIINDVNTSQGILDRGVMSIAVDTLFLVGVTIFLIFWNWELAAVSLFTLPVHAGIFGYLRPRLRTAANDMQAQMSRMSGEVNEKITGLSVVQSFVRERSELFRFFGFNRDYLRTVIRHVRLRFMLLAVGEFLTQLGPVIVLSYGTYRVLGGAITTGQLLTFYGSLTFLYQPTQRLADATAAVQLQLAAMDRVFRVMDVAPEIQDAPDAQPLQDVHGRIEFDNVHFAYEPGQPVLEGIDLTVEPGRSMAFVGKSGAGKSTLIKLVPRFYDVTQGAIRIDGQDIRTVTLHSLRSHIGMVMQDAILFNTTVRENIRYGRRGASEAEMLTAARMAHVDEFVDELPAGYDTVVGEHGVTLSGGQKQRLSIARAFLRDPEILILDEATSSLDSHAEAIIQDALAHLMRGRTTLVIAHRLSTIVDCDQVAFIDAGRIVQRGTHQELASAPGPYRALCEEQFGAVQLSEL
ncbi:MAG: ABC transporter ATP-binding protein [Candidatus Hydrogenedentota bacterium]